MNRDRKYAIVTGVLFIIGTVPGVLSLGLLGSLPTASDYLTKLSANAGRVTLSAFLIFIMAVACSGIAVAMYPVLKRYYPALALSSVCFRVIEGVFHVLGGIILLTLLTLSHEFVKFGVPSASYFQTLGAVLTAGRNFISNGAAILTWCTGALIYYWIFYQTKIVPRWLSVWGLLGVTLSIIASILIVFQIVTDKSILYILLNAPIAFQEMVLAVWLIVKGFSPGVNASGSASITMI